MPDEPNSEYRSAILNLGDDRRAYVVALARAVASDDFESVADAERSDARL